MSRPLGFSWVEPSRLAAMARPFGPEELLWLRDQGIQLIISLTEEPLRRDWVNDAGLLAIHIPIGDMCAPLAEQFDEAISAIRRAHDQGIGVAIHCFAGHGRTGTLLAGYFVSQGMSAEDAISRVRELRPGSIETPEQELAVAEYALRQKEQARQTPDDVIPPTSAPN